MKALIILYLWQVLASDRLSTHVGWVDRGEYQSVAACERAVQRLGVKDGYYRCIPQE